MQRTLFKPSLLTAILLSASALAHADQPSLSFVELGYGQTNIDGSIFAVDSFKGFNIAASYEFTDTIYVPVSYYRHSGDSSDVFENSFNTGDGSGNIITINQLSVSDNSIDLSEFSIGLGYKLELSDSSFLATDLSVLQVKVSVSFDSSFTTTENGVVTFSDVFSDSESSTENGFLLRSVYQKLLDNGFQFNVGLQYKLVRAEGENIDDTAVLLDGLYHFTDNLSAKLGASISGDKQLSATLRYSF